MFHFTFLILSTLLPLTSPRTHTHLSASRVDATTGKGTERQAKAMANVQQTQAFYALTLEAPSAPTAAVLCNVIPGLKAGDQQIFEARGQHVLLHRITESADRTERKITTVCDQDVFGIVRGVAAFRIPATATGKSSQPKHPLLPHYIQVLIVMAANYSVWMTGTLRSHHEAHKVNIE